MKMKRPLKVMPEADSRLLLLQPLHSNVAAVAEDLLPQLPLPLLLLQPHLLLVN